MVEKNSKEMAKIAVAALEEKKAEDIRRLLLERNSRLEIRINTISAVIAAHTGLDCIAIQYIEK